MERTILLIEDDAPIARMLMGAMEMWGYKAVYAASADEAIAVAQAHLDGLVMVICDVNLPETSGPALAGMIRAICPRVKTCFTSGYPLPILSDRGVLTLENLRDGVATYLQKPFLPEDLRRRIAWTLDQTDALREDALERKEPYVTAACF